MEEEETESNRRLISDIIMEYLSFRRLKRQKQPYVPKKLFWCHVKDAVTAQQYIRSPTEPLQNRFHLHRCFPVVRQI